MSTTTSQPRQGKHQSGFRQNGQWVISLNQLAVVAVIVFVAVMLTIAALMAGSAQTATPLGAAPGDTTSAQALGENYDSSSAIEQVLAGFGLLGAWVIVGAFSLARSRGSKEFRFGQPNSNLKTSNPPTED